MTNDIVLHYIASLLYIGLGVAIWHNFRSYAYITIIICIAITHGMAVHLDMFSQPNIALETTNSIKSIKINWSLSISFVIWLGFIIYIFESTLFKIKGFLLILSPLGVCACILAAIYPASQKLTSIPIFNNTFLFHLILSFFGYSVIAIAAMQAIIMANLDKFVRNPENLEQKTGFFVKIINAQPPLMVQERILFRLIWIGFMLLTISIITGIFVSIQATGHFLPHDHKTFFTIFSWIVFGVLLLGRVIWGWRGHITLRWTLIGFILLVLAYTGTHFILEVLLHRS